MALKVSAYSTQATALAAGDLFDLTKLISTSPNVYESQKADINLLEGWNLFGQDFTMPAPRLHNLSNNQFSLTNGRVLFKGSDDIGTDLFTLEDLSGNDILRVQNNGNLFTQKNLSFDLDLNTINFLNTNDFIVNFPATSAGQFIVDGSSQSASDSILFEVKSVGTGNSFNIDQKGEIESTGITGTNILNIRNSSNTLGLNIKSGVSLFHVSQMLTRGAEAYSNGIRQVFTSTTEEMKWQQASSSDFNHQIKSGTAAGSNEVRFFNKGWANSDGFIIGGASAIGSEDISLQGSTLVNDKFEVLTTDHGVLLPRVDNAQMAAITADTNEIVFNTDLNGLYRWNGSAWVALSAGYGIVQVIRDTDNGQPTFYADLQSALETCKTAGSSNTINLYSDITITSSININRNGTGTGNGYLFKNLTIDFNGFTLTNNESDSSYCFDIDMGNQPTEERTIHFKNGFVNRTSGTGTHYALHSDEIENHGHITMQNMKWYCQNSLSVRLEIDELDSSYKDFGGSVFESDSGYPLWLQHYSCKNFTTISNSSAASFYIIGGSKASSFEVFNTSTGDGIDIGDASFIYDFEVNVSSGIGIDCFDDFDGECSRFKIITTTGDGIETTGTSSVYKPDFSHFVINSQNGVCIDSNHKNTDFSNFIIINNGTNDTLNTLNNSDVTFKNGIVKNLGSGNALDVTNTREMNFEFVDFTSFSDSAVDISLDNAIYNVVFKNCNFFSKLDTTSGHSAEISNSTGSINFMNCTFETFNSGANGLYAASARTISVGNSGFKGMTTPINANITISLTTAPDGNGNYTT